MGEDLYGVTLIDYLQIYELHPNIVKCYSCHTPLKDNITLTLVFNSKILLETEVIVT